MITEHFLPIYFPTGGPDIGTMLIYKDAPAGYLKEHFQKWCEIAQAEMDSSREHEINAVYHVQKAFIQLIDAVYATSAAIGSVQSTCVLDELLQQYFDTYFKKDVNRAAIPLPTSFCRSFFKGITAQSTKAILWLLLHAVAANKEKYQYDIELYQMLNLFHRYTAIIIVAEDWREILNDRKGKKGVKYSKKKNKQRK